MNVKQIIHKGLSKLYRENPAEFIRDARNQFEDKYYSYGDLPEITDDELNQYRKAWPMWDVQKRDLTWARVCKKAHGFSPYIIGNYHTWLLRQAFNPQAQLSSFENKAMCDIYFPEISFPEPYLRRINGLYYDAKMKSLSEKDAVNLLSSCGDYVIKPALDSMQGQGVEKICLAKQKIPPFEAVWDSFQRQKGDFICQEVLAQHPSIAAFNPTSLNTCRVTSIYINGKFGTATCVKFGKKGAEVDNWRVSYFCGVDNQGRLTGEGFDNQLRRVTQSDNGLELKGALLPDYEKMIQFVEKTHKHLFPNCGIIGWDIVIDVDGNVRVIETNMTTVGIVIEQLATGDFFRDFRDEICTILKKQ